MKYDKHIIFITVGFPHNEAETDCIPPMQNFIKEFKLNYPQIKISVISLFYPFIESNYLWYNIPVYTLGIKGNSLMKIFKLKAVEKLFNNIYNPSEETVIQSFWLSHCALIGNKIARMYKLKHFCMTMGQDLKLENKFRFLLPSKKMTIICPNRHSEDKLLRVFGRKADYIIPRGIDSDSFTQVNKVRTIDILGVGNFGKLKNFESFLKVILNLKYHFNTINVAIIGKGKQEKLLNEFVIKNDLKNNVKFLGHISRELVIETMQRTKILLHTSLFEDESYAITEALYAKMYVVAYESVHQKRTNLFLGNNDEALVNLCKNVLSNYKLPNNNEVYTITQMINDFHKIYFS